jgi:hypothetical protein
MDYRIGNLRTEEIARKWLALAERRLEYLDDLHRSGRYQKFFTEQSLLAIKRATQQTARQWASLLPPMMSAPEATVTPRDHAEENHKVLSEREHAAACAPADKVFT